MASKLALSLVIGGAVASSVGAAFRTVEGGIDKLKKKGDKAKVLQSTIGETMKLQAEWKRAHDSGAAGADKLLKKLNGNLNALRAQGVEVGRLGREYQRLAREARAADLQIKGRTQIGDGMKGAKGAAGQAVALSASLAVPTKISGDYQAKIRQMALWAHIAGQGEEQQLADKIAKVAADVGMGQQALAAAVGGLIEKGIDWQESVDYAPLIADLIDGQGMEGETIATLFSAFKEAGVKKEDMGAMLGQVAAAGDIGAFGPKDMARYMPSLLGTIKTLGMEGPEAVRFLGASLQSQYKQTQDSASAATNMNNLLTAVISSTSQERFAKQGIDLAGSIAQATKTGKAANPVEAFIKLTDVLLKQQNPAKFKEVEALKKRIQASADGSAEEAQAMASLLQSAGLAGIVSDQSASAGLLAQIKYGDVIKDDMATIKATDGKVKIEQDAEKARETSNAKWGTTKAAAEATMTRLGDAIRPLTDRAADALSTVSYAIADLTQKAPAVVASIVSIGAALIAAKAAFNGFKVARGLMNVTRGTLMGRRRNERAPVELPRTGNKVVDTGLGVLGKVLGSSARDDAVPMASNEPQRVFVVNAEAFGRYGPGAANTGLGGPKRARRVRRRRQVGQLGATRSPFSAPFKPVPAAVKAPVRLTPVVPPAAKVAAPAPVPAAAKPQVRLTPVVPPAPAAEAPAPMPRRPQPALPAVGVSALAPRAPVAPELSRLGQMVHGVRGMTRAAGRLPGGQLADAIPGVLDIALNAQTRDEKAEGYGGLAGGLAGAWAGGAAGAAIGSVVPIIGTAIGGAIGIALGGLGGDALGGWLGRTWFGEDKPQQEQARADGQAGAESQPAAPAAPAAPVAVMPAPVIEAPKPLQPTLQPPVVLQPEPVTKAQAPVATVPAPIAKPPAPVAQGVTPPSAPVTVQPPVVTVTAPGSQQPVPVVKVEAGSPTGLARPKQEPAPAAQDTPKPADRERPGFARGLRRHAVERADSMGDVVRSLVEVTAPSAAAPAPVPPKPAERTKAEPPKVEQTFSIALSMPVTIQGDVKDPYQTVAAMEAPLRGLFDRLQREFAGNRFSAQLYDEAHV